MGFLNTVTVQRSFKGRGYSGGVWHDCPTDLILGDTNQGVFMGDDFVGPSAHVFASATPAVGYTTFQSAGATIIPSTRQYGGLNMATAGTSNHSASLQGNGGPVRLGLGRDAQPLWFEAKLGLGVVAAVASFVGLSEPANALTGTLADTTGALSDKNFFGFHTLAATPTRVDIVYRKAGQTAVTVKEGVHTLVAGEEVKLGFRFTPRNTDRVVAEFFVNGDTVHELKLDDITVASFPENEAMNRLVSLKTTAAVIKSATLDWWALAQKA